MGLRHFIRLAVVAVWQVLTVAAVLYFDSSPQRWIPSLCALAALLPPFVCYIVAVYDAPLFARWSRALKAGVLTLLSIVLTIGGYCALFFIGLFIQGKM
jgi:hypothetical protein